MENLSLVLASMPQEGTFEDYSEKKVNKTFSFAFH
jgi:hypothetical protein